MDYPSKVSDEPLWIFGYGSLVWRPAFAYRRSSQAFIRGWVRRFWQGSTDHRGVPSQPGRVVTLISAEDPMLSGPAGPVTAPCWGSAYEVAPPDRDAVLAALDHRERAGYVRTHVDITLRLGPGPEQSVRGLVYVASAENDDYLGPASIERIADQIFSASGLSGPNLEYVEELARSLRAMQAEDSHVFEVEAALARRVRERSA